MSRPVGLNLSNEERALICSMYKEGRGTAEIAQLMQVSKSTVSRLTLREGLRKPLAVAGKRLTEDQLDTIVKLYTETYLPKTEIAKRVGCGYDAVQEHTRGLSRALSEELASYAVSSYLSGEKSSDELKKALGVPKKILLQLVGEHYAS